MPDFDTMHILDEDQVEITDLDPHIDGSSTSVPFLLLRFARKLPLFNEPRSRFTLLVYLMCAVVLLFMIQPGMPIVPRQNQLPSAQELHYPLAIYPFIKDTTQGHSVTWVRISNGQVIAIQSGPGRIVGHHCKVQRSFVPPKYANPAVVVCT